MEARRYDALIRNPSCMVCGASARSGARMNVDHINPLSRRWDFRVSARNLQTLCASCNWGKADGDPPSGLAIRDRARLYPVSLKDEGVRVWHSLTGLNAPQWRVYPAE